MHESDKNFRRNKFNNKYLKKYQVSQEEKFISKSNKHFKNKKQKIKEEEPWEDWDNPYNNEIY